MSSSHSLDTLAVQFDDANLVANAGLILPATLAQHLGLEELYRSYVHLGDAPGRANVGIKAMTLIHSALAGGDCIEDADVAGISEGPCLAMSTVMGTSDRSGGHDARSWHCRATADTYPIPGVSGPRLCLANAVPLNPDHSLTGGRQW